MPSPWSEDLSYDYYRRIVGALLARFEPILLRDAPARLADPGPLAIVRHDIDVSPRKALAMARLEHELGLRSTYLFLVSSPLYDIEDARCRGIFSELRAMGHDIGLHFELEAPLRAAGCSPDAVEEQIRRDADRLSRAAGLDVAALSFHRPIATFLRGQMRLAGLVNAYAEQLMRWYVSDSNGSWREGEPIPLVESGRHQRLQMLVHPIWWGEDHLAAGERLSAFHREESDGWPERECERLNEALREGVQLPGWTGAAAGAAAAPGSERP